MSIILAMCLFSLSMSISPGPVNLIALSSGVNHGFISTLHFVSGATVGFIALFVIVGLGVGQVANNSLLILELMRYAGATFIAYIGYRIITSRAQLDTVKVNSSTFTKGVLLQWLNPKAWIASVSGIAAFNIKSFSQLVLFATLYFIICYASISVWVYAGEQSQKLLNEARNIRIFNFIMGGALVLVAVYLALIDV